MVWKNNSSIVPYDWALLCLNPLLPKGDHYILFDIALKGSVCFSTKPSAETNSLGRVVLVSNGFLN